MSYNAKNYTEQGGEKTVIGGTLEIKEGASVTGLPSQFTSAENQSRLYCYNHCGTRSRFQCAYDKTESCRTYGGR